MTLRTKGFVESEHFEPWTAKHSRSNDCGQNGRLLKSGIVMNLLAWSNGIWWHSECITYAWLNQRIRRWNL